MAEKAGDALRSNFTRRTFIAWGLGGLLTAIGAMVLPPILIYLWPNGSAQAKTKVTVRLSNALSKLEDDIPLRFDAPSGVAFTLISGGGDNSVGDPAFAGWVVRGTRTGGKTMVFAVNCPHLGCDVGFDASSDIFQCPCHGSEFQLDGNVLRGPAAAPMALLGWTPGSTSDELLVEGVVLPTGF